MESAKDVGKNVEVNKHQKALNNLIKNDYEYFDEETNSHLYDKDLRKLDINILQTLVDKVPYYKELEDKVTPMKPLNTRINHNGLKVGGCECLYHIDNHRSTNTEVDETYNFCKKCGKALDWSKDER